MGFRLVPKSVTLNDLKRRNDHVVCVISPNSAVVGTYYVKVVEDTPLHSGVYFTLPYEQKNFAAEPYKLD